MNMRVTPQEIAERALSAAGSDAIVIVEHDCVADLRWARSTLTTNGERTTTTLTVIAFHHRGDGVGTATLSMTGPDTDSAEALGRAAQVAAASAPAATDASDLLTPSDLSGLSDTALRWADPAELTSGSALAPITAGLGEALGSGARDDIEHFGYAEHSVTTTWLASSTGVRLRWAQPSGRIEMTAKSHARSRSAWQGAAHEDLSRIDVAQLDRALRQGLRWQATKVPVQPGRHTALLTSGAVADLACDIWWYAAARDAAEGRSVFSRPGGGTRVGERITPRRITIGTDPADLEMPYAPFDIATSSNSHSSVFDNAMPVTAAAWIADGTVGPLVAPRATAKELNCPVVSSGSNLRVTDADGHGTLEELIARTQDALLVTCVWYNRVVDPQTLLITGLSRDGVYVVKDGEIVGSAGNFRFNESPVGMLARVTDAGATTRTQPREMADYVARIAAPPMVIDGFNFSTASDAL
jgi:predicted Zn-dependent protease